MRGAEVNAAGNESVRAGCGGCAGATTRRLVLGRISAVAVAAMVGVELRPETALALPVVEGTGAAGDSDIVTYPVPPEDVVTIDRDQQVIVVRFQKSAWAFNLACPHENTALRWKDRKGHFQCPRHESEYQPDGTFISGRATRNMDRFAITREGSTLRVDLDRLYRSDENPAEWSAAAVSL